MVLEGKTVLITGATGFIGGRLVEKLSVEHGVTVRALVHDFHHSAWLSRIPVEMVYGELTDREALRRATSGCSVVFHCAVGSSPFYQEAYSVNVEGTRNLMEVARESGVERMVHISSIAVHKCPLNGGIITEDSEFTDQSADAYARTKLEGEQLALQLSRESALSTVVIRPTIVYGPRSGMWTAGLARRIQQKQFAWSQRLSGEANLVHVDDVVQGLLLAATVPNISGEAFIIASESGMAWKDYVSLYSAMTGTELPTRPWWITKALAAAFENLEKWVPQLQKQPTFWSKPVIFAMRAIRKVLKPWRGLMRWELKLFQQQQRVSIAKAKSVLGYQPSADINAKMAEIEYWLRSQNYLPATVDEAFQWPTS